MPKTTVYIDDKLWEEFQEFVLSKYGRLHGFLSKELEEAIRFYLNHMECTHAQKQPTHKIKQKSKFIKLLKFLLNYDEIPEYEIVEFIQKEFGVDRRTINKYLYIARQYLEPMVKTRKVTIYRVNKDKIKEVLNDQSP